MNKLWTKFSDLMAEVPKYIDEAINGGDFGVSTSTIVQGGKKIVITTKNGETTIRVNGKEYVEK